MWILLGETDAVREDASADREGPVVAIQHSVPLHKPAWFDELQNSPVLSGRKGDYARMEATVVVEPVVADAGDGRLRRRLRVERGDLVTEVGTRPPRAGKTLMTQSGPTSGASSPTTSAGSLGPAQAVATKTAVTSSESNLT